MSTSVQKSFCLTWSSTHWLSSSISVLAWLGMQSSGTENSIQFVNTCLHRADVCAMGCGEDLEAMVIQLEMECSYSCSSSCSGSSGQAAVVRREKLVSEAHTNSSRCMPPCEDLSKPIPAAGQLESLQAPTLPTPPSPLFSFKRGPPVPAARGLPPPPTFYQHNQVINAC